jgi:hypothetical protein
MIKLNRKKLRIIKTLKRMKRIKNSKSLKLILLKKRKLNWKNNKSSKLHTMKIHFFSKISVLK